MTGNPIVIFPYSRFGAFPAAERDWLAKLARRAAPNLYDRRGRAP
ncbi:hypothetical protein [Paenibacillus algorifonticola]|nr:hypothetical protein [Paenibacillus algorifonticola]